MSSDLQRFLRAVRTLAKLADKYDRETHLDALGRYATKKQEDDLLSVGAFLDDIGQQLLRQRLAAKHSCRQCGNDVHNVLVGTTYVVGAGRRTAAQYCSPACRQ